MDVHLGPACWASRYRSSSAATLYVGLPSGNGLAYTWSGAPGKWTRAAGIDLPDVGFNATPTFADLDGDGNTDLLVGARSGAVVAFLGTGTATQSFRRAAA